MKHSGAAGCLSATRVCIGKQIAISRKTSMETSTDAKLSQLA